MVGRGGSRQSRTVARPPFAVAALFTYLSQVAAAVIALVNVLVIARALGPAGRGDVAFLATIVFLTSQLAALGVHQAHSNLAGRSPHLRPALATNSIVFSVVLGAASIGVVAGLIALFPALAGDADASARWLALASIPVIIFELYLLYLVQADYGFAAANLAHVVGPLLTAAVNGILAAMGELTVFAAIATMVGGYLASTALLVWYVQRRLAGFGRPDRALVRPVVGFGIKVHAGRVMLTGNYRLDQWFVGAIAGSRELGLYSVAVAWAEALFFLPQAFVNVQRPDLVRAQPTEAARQAATLFRAAMLLTVAPAVIMVVSAPVLCTAIFGKEFAGSVDDLRVLAFGAFGIVSLKLLGDALTAQSRPGLETAAVAVAFAITVALDIVLIPPYGGLGAAVASTIAYTAGGLAVAVLFARALGARMSDLVPRGRDLLALWRRAASGFRTS
ncbi:MAG TPA: oligosaccharide flippase family protein [Gaiellaceae bacterium]|nr:oligosaccharide flippase family protein [Gaiellaceae bacterium]